MDPGQYLCNSHSERARRTSKATSPTGSGSATSTRNSWRRVIVSLPIADRRTSFAFHGAGLGFDAIGEPVDDGVPEPLQFAVNDGVRLMLIPAGGFDWVVGDREVAGRGHNECLFSLGVETETGVDELVERAYQAGAEIVTQPGQQPWGYAGTFADPPTAMSGW